MSSSPTADMLHLINDYSVSRAIFVAASLGLPDLVRDGSRSCAELSAATNTDAAALYRLIRVLASAGVFALLPNGQVGITELSSTLLSDAPGSLRGWAVDQLGGEHYLAWGELIHSVKTGEVAFEHVFGTSAWAHRADHPASAKAFDEGMASFIGAHHQAVLQAYPFSSFASLYDIGGGDGQFMEAMLLANPNLHGLVLDLPYVAPRASQRLQAAGLLDRCEVVAGNIFESIPKGGSAYLLSRMIHDWNDVQATQILLVCRQAIGEQGVLLLVERIMPDEITPLPSTRALAVSDLNMLVMTGGCERTKAHYQALLHEASFEVRSITATSTALSVIEARPI